MSQVKTNGLKTTADVLDMGVLRWFGKVVTSPENNISKRIAKT